MLAQLSQTGPSGGGHPVWHFAVVAAAALGVFVAIKAREWSDRHPPIGLASGEAESRGRKRAPLARPSGPLVLLALASAGASAVHASVCPEHFREAAFLGVFFLAASAGQAAWAVLILVRPSRTLLLSGAIANAGMLMLWAITRTVGLPIGPVPWRAEAISAPDALATQLEVALALGVVWVIFESGRNRVPATGR